jgi:ABC-2 type transport system ATP-binding protein
MAVVAGPVGPAERGAATPAVEVHALTKSYGGRRALDGVDLRLSAGTVLGLLGPNGAGKTTLIRLLSTVLSPDSGSFTVAGVPHTRPAQVRRAVGVLPESAGYPRNQTCEEWLTLHARLFGHPREEARTTVWRLLDEVGLSDRRSSLIAGLSRGMRQRLGIARALVNDPPVVFLDEPTLGLDPAGQKQVLELISRITREHGVSVVLSTHVLAEVEQVCDHVVILNRGRVVADGTVGEVTRRAAAPRQGVVRVPSHLRALALDALVAQRIAAGAPDGHRDEVELHLPGDAPPEESSTRVLRCLLDAGVPVLGLTLEGGRLSDAFLAVTQGADHE